MATATSPPETDTPKSIDNECSVALAQPYRVDGDPVSSQTASLTRRNAMQRHVDRLITRGRLLHTSGCSICKRIFALPLTEQRSLIANARPDYSEPGSKRLPLPPQ